MPLACLMIDMLINKVRMKQNFFLQLIFLFIYFMITAGVEQSMGMPTYPENLNWFCSKKESLLVDKSTGVVSMTFPDRTCAEIKEIKKDKQQATEALVYKNKACEPIYQHIYCGSEANVKHPITGKLMTKWSIWGNALLFVLVVVILHLSSYLLCRLIHQLKTCCDNPSAQDEDDEEIEKE